MSVLVVQDLKKILGSQEILRGATLRVDNGEKVGIVGRNGEGKTTFLRLLTGEETPDMGTLQLAKGARVGYVSQRPQFDPGMTARRYVEGGLDEVHRVEKDLEAAAEAMSTAQGDELERVMRRHGELTARMEFLGGWESERRVETVMGGIGLDESLWDREAVTLSGGEKSRTQMARELVSVPDLLLLDEPTNHLDVSGIEWLEGYLKEIHSAVLMVSHDRRMLDQVVDTIVQVERGLLERYPGNYSRYVQLKEERFSSEHRAWQQQQELIRKEESFIKKHMGSQRTAEAKGRRKKLSNLERLAQPYNDVRRPTIRVASVERGGEVVLRAEGLSVGHGGTPLLEGIDLRIGRGQRIGIIGPNGTGKTTLLRVLAGRAQPMGGSLEFGHKARCGFFDQETADLRDDGTPYTEIRRDHPLLTDLEIRSHLARFLFRGKDIDLPVPSLSGGERSRLSIARLVLTEPSWLAIDEPTNHLDLAGRTALEEMLSEFPGALVCISHDRAFLDGLCNTIVEVHDGKVTTYPGNYSHYLATKKAAEDDRREAVAQRKKKAREAEKKKAAAVRNENGAKAKKKGKQKGSKGKKARNPWALERLEEEIIGLEERRTDLMGKLASEEVYRNPDALRTTQVELAEIERDLEDKNSRWAEWS